MLCQKASLRRISRSVGKRSQRCCYHVNETCVNYCRGLKLDYILNTHHHWDHTGGNEELKSKFKCTIVGPKADKGRIPGIDVALGDGESWQFGDLKMEVLDTPGHTRGHITLWFPQVEALFPGQASGLCHCTQQIQTVVFRRYVQYAALTQRNVESNLTGQSLSSCIMRHHAS